MEAGGDEERKRQRGSVLIWWQEGMFEDKQRQRASAQEAEGERKRSLPLRRQPSWTINVWWFYISTGLHQSGLQGHGGILGRSLKMKIRRQQDLLLSLIQKSYTMSDLKIHVDLDRHIRPNLFLYVCFTRHGLTKKLSDLLIISFNPFTCPPAIVV